MIERLLNAIRARVAGMVTRGVISMVNDKLKTQGLQVTLRFDEVADRVEHLQPWGVSFHPTRGSECVVLAVGGSQDHLLALGATNREHRPTDIKEGEGGLYTDTGWKVFCDQDGNVALTEQSPAQWIARADRVDAAIKNIHAAIELGMNSTKKGGLDGGLAAFTAAYGLLQEPATKSDKGKVT